MEFLFLVSHGLLSPISAVRWGTSRLQRLAKDLSPEQQYLIEHIHGNAKRLATAFSSMLLLARNEDQTYTLTSTVFPVQELLALYAVGSEHPSNVKLRVACPSDATVEGDRALLEAAFHNIFAVLQEALSEPRAVTIEVQPEEESVAINIICPLELSVQTVRSAHDGDVRPVVGGTPGLLLSLTSSLLTYTGGSLDMRETDEGRYRITVRLPRVEN